MADNDIDVGQRVEENRGKVTGVENRGVRRDEIDRSSSAHINVALNRVADELGQMEKLVKEVSELRAQVSTLVRELIGDERFKAAGIAQRLADAERQLFLGRVTVAILVFFEVLQWLVLLYHAWTWPGSLSYAPGVVSFLKVLVTVCAFWLFS